ncbi:predicted protein [Histoplasma capsulatum G186AR]|uniref:Uncharacterized protein n=1 Tax=Ajellomyces capsulatus (strain G186AR / H82 / ATCC MYA-2454 / RMSCC 2432) TaxID=447093 RepID=C0NQ49_AJECG|nr:uncharacterized protein HCBG_05279 [Histoplasma capsulatum G186AR]EEH07059.1 predicted protein [Histoplasma capsulatum G186AR]
MLRLAVAVYRWCCGPLWSGPYHHTHGKENCILNLALHAFLSSWAERKSSTGSLKGSPGRYPFWILLFPYFSLVIEGVSPPLELKGSQFESDVNELFFDLF